MHPKSMTLAHFVAPQLYIMKAMIHGNGKREDLAQQAASDGARCSLMTPLQSSTQSWERGASLWADPRGLPSHQSSHQSWNHSNLKMPFAAGQQPMQLGTALRGQWERLRGSGEHNPSACNPPLHRKALHFATHPFTQKLMSPTLCF